MDLFSNIQDQHAPLAEKLRPHEWKEVFGQEKLTEKNGALRRLTEKNELPSLILWGPPGTGKTTLAKLIAEKTESYFINFSAVTSGIADLKKAVEEAKSRKMQNQKTILFLDEIHRWNKSQQDAILPHAENGTLTLIGATTENPSFEINSALLSRSEVIVLNPLDEPALEKILNRALKTLPSLKLNKKGKDFLVKSSNSDARTLLNRVEILKNFAPKNKSLTEKDISKILDQKVLRYDKSGEEHFNLISALHKSMRGSDPDAALYYLARMLDGGEDPLYIARRVVRFASEDIGNADPSALAVALRAKDSYDFLGTPEGELALAQAVVYLSTCPKSNAIYKAWNEVQSDIKKHGNLEVPKKIRNAPTKLMKNLDYGKDYKYAHDYKEGFVPGETYLPEKLKNKKYYHPTERGLEKTIKKRLDTWRDKK